MQSVSCPFYDGEKGNIHFVRGGGPGFSHRGQDNWRHPRTTNTSDIEILVPYLCRIDWAGTMAGEKNETWGILAKGLMLEGPCAGDSFLVAHMNSVSVQVGSTYQAGARLGYEGWTGHTIPAGPGGKHSHIELLKGTSYTYKDPAPLTGISNSMEWGVDYINTYRIGKTPVPPTIEYNVGDIVYFIGRYHYTSSRGNEKYVATPGPARITAINLSGNHQYHLVHTTGESNVYGWVDADTFSKSTDERITIGSKVMIKAGAKDYSGKSLASFVYSTTYTVLELSGDRAVVGINGQVTAAMHTSDLIKV